MLCRKHINGSSEVINEIYFPIFLCSLLASARWSRRKSQTLYVTRLPLKNPLVDRQLVHSVPGLLNYHQANLLTRVHRYENHIRETERGTGFFQCVPPSFV